MEGRNDHSGDDRRAPGGLRRGTKKIVPQTVIPMEDLLARPVPVDNVIVAARTPEQQWIADATEQIGEWRNLLRSTYVQWCLAVNALCLAGERYGSAPWVEGRARFTVDGYRPVRPGGFGRSVIAAFTGPDVAEHHLATVGKVTTWGFVDLFGMFEDLVFDLYRLYWWANPQAFLRDDPDLRAAWRERSRDDAARQRWEAAFERRLDAWQRRKAYEGLHKVLLAFFDRTRLQPNPASRTGPAEWAASLRLIATVRNSIVHGAQSVSPELVTALEEAKPYHLDFSFVLDERLEVGMDELARAELFAHQLLNAINLSLVHAIVGDSVWVRGEDKGT